MNKNKLIKILIWVPGFFWLFPLVCCLGVYINEKGKDFFLNSDIGYFALCSPFQGLYCALQVFILLILVL